MMSNCSRRPEPEARCFFVLSPAGGGRAAPAAAREGAGGRERGGGAAARSAEAPARQFMTSLLLAPPSHQLPDTAAHCTPRAPPGTNNEHHLPPDHNSPNPLAAAWAPATWRWRRRARAAAAAAPRSLPAAPGDPHGACPASSGVTLPLSAAGSFLSSASTMSCAPRPTPGRALRFGAAYDGPSPPPSLAVVHA